MFRRVWGPAAQGCCYPRVGDIGGCDQHRNIYLDSSGAIPIDMCNTRRILSSELVVTASCPMPCHAKRRHRRGECHLGDGFSESHRVETVSSPQGELPEPWVRS